MYTRICVCVCVYIYIYIYLMFYEIDKLSNCFPERLYHFTFPPAVYESYSCQHLGWAVFLILTILLVKWWYLILVLIFIALMTTEVEHLSCANLSSVYLLSSEVSVQKVFFCFLLCCLLLID